ncbi:P-loop containing nucleoside triphosphate hydrolase protein [Syncephalis fuscata]|nr:P-loop containing nucleoside triphosphate hydrolase protein [Syncephalis fuscata]
MAMIQRSKKNSSDRRRAKRSKEEKEIDELNKRYAESLSLSEVVKFSDVPISSKTLQGLNKSNFVEMTDIQRKSIPLALQKRDILGAARTGSGKTLAFLVPIIEILYRERWSQYDGIGALVISPTRELAVQIFNVLCQFGKEHSFSAGLVIGGKDLKTEQERITRMNILVCTPGRLLQHMDQTPNFDCSRLQMLVLDEADRILDMGFAKTLNAIIDNLPAERQTMLFSATQTKSVKDLARLSLKNPEYVAVHEQSEFSTPKQLQQHYMVTELQSKLDMLYSFIKTHLQCKALVFFSSCKQVRFAYETFCKLQPGVQIMQLHGKQKQQKRIDIFSQFSRSKHSFLFCTDIAARGLDFPAVDWVIQVDCPEDADTGTCTTVIATIRGSSNGRIIKAKRVPIEKIRVKQSRKQVIQQQMQAFCFKDPEIKYLGQKAFVSYVRSVYLQKNKDIFDVNALPLEEFASSFGLPGAPRIRFVKKSDEKNVPRQAQKPINIPEMNDEDDDNSDEDSGKDSDAEESSDAASKEDESEDEKVAEKQRPKTKIEKMFLRKNQSILADHYTRLVNQEDDKVAAVSAAKLTDALADADGDDEFMTLKRVDHDLDDSTPELIEAQSKRSMRKTKKDIAKNAPRGEKLLFDDEGEAHPVYEFEALDDFMKAGDVTEKQKAYVEENLAAMRDADATDRQMAREKRREKRLKRKLREQEEANNNEDDDKYVVQLGGISDEGEADSGSDEGHFGMAQISDTESKRTLKDQFSQETEREPNWLKQKSLQHWPSKKDWRCSC